MTSIAPHTAALVTPLAAPEGIVQRASHVSHTRDALGLYPAAGNYPTLGLSRVMTFASWGGVGLDFHWGYGHNDYALLNEYVVAQNNTHIHHMQMPLEWVGTQVDFGKEVSSCLNGIFMRKTLWVKNWRRWVEHLPIASEKHLGLLSYYQTPEKRARNIRTPIKAGKYLKKYFGDLLSETDIHEWALDWANHYAVQDVKITQDENEIAAVYKGNYLGSCMHFERDDYNGPVHPASVYGGELDLGLAYLGDMHQAAARTLVWPSKKLFYGKTYGDGPRLIAALIKVGYSEGIARDFFGARLQRLPVDNAFVLPYLDCCESVTDTGTHLIIDPHGTVCARGTEGVSGLLERCGGCNEAGEDLTAVDSLLTSYCPSCIGNHAFYCEVLDDYGALEGRTEVLGYGDVSSRGLDHLLQRGRVFFCEHSERYYCINDYTAVTTTDGEVYEADVFYEAGLGFYCAYAERYVLFTTDDPFDLGNDELMAFGTATSLPLATLHAWAVRHSPTAYDAIVELRGETLAEAA